MDETLYWLLCYMWCWPLSPSGHTYSSCARQFPRRDEWMTVMIFALVGPLSVCHCIGTPVKCTSSHLHTFTKRPSDGYFVLCPTMTISIPWVDAHFRALAVIPHTMHSFAGSEFPWLYNVVTFIIGNFASLFETKLFMVRSLCKFEPIAEFFR